MVNVLKFRTLFCSVLKQIVRAGIHKMLVRIAKREDPEQTRSSLIWVRTVCLGLFDMQLVFEILKHLIAVPCELKG